MKDFVAFLVRLARHLGVEDALKLPSSDSELAVVAANILHEINKFLYQKTPDLPKPYISEFHRFWKDHHEEILAPQIDVDTCWKIANVLEPIFRDNKIKIAADTLDLTKEQIAQVRFFTAIQDFKIDIGRRGNPFEIYKHVPECFSPAELLKNELLVTRFLDLIKAESQTDKRKAWMLASARLLETDYGGSAFNLCARNGGDASRVRIALTATEGYGFSKKKADMLLRDLADLEVWSYSGGADCIDVMSDANTMRIALRTGILRLRMPLLASYLDVYCYQYGLIDAKNAEAWRNVWYQWEKIANNHKPPTPASMDYLIFKMGKLSCRKSSRKCPPEKPRGKKKLQTLLKQDRLLYEGNGFCIFKDICPMERKPLQPPKSISILGQTGWESGWTNEGGGLGISS